MSNDNLVVDREDVKPCSPWISIKDRLPESEQNVLFFISYKKYEEYTDDKWGDMKYSYCIQGYILIHEEDSKPDFSTFFSCPHMSFSLLTLPPQWVTHWMPLPEPPK